MLLTLIIGSLLILFAFYLFVVPENFMKENVKDGLINEIKNDFSKDVGISFKNAMILSFKENRSDSETFFSLLEKSIDGAIEKKIFAAIKFFGLLLIFSGLILLYISRMTKNTKKRNTSISKAEKLTQNVLIDYMKLLKKERKS